MIADVSCFICLIYSEEVDDMFVFLLLANDARFRKLFLHHIVTTSNMTTMMKKHILTCETYFPP